MLTDAPYLIKKAQKGGYALGAFNIYNLETALGVARAAVHLESPIVMQVSESTIEYAGLKPITHIVSTIAKNEAISIPVALHLDHGKSFKSVAECIAAGFSSVHIDASSLPFDENIALTREVVEYAHGKSIWVQGELGAIPGGHGEEGSKYKELPLVDPDQVEEFVKKTGVDALAVAVGTAHGVFKNEEIHFDLLKEVRNRTSLPLVLHGGSGIPDNQVKKAIKMGICIINVGTDIKLSFTSKIKEVVKKNSKVSDVRELMNPAINAVQKVVERKLKLFGSVGKK
ncbi:MAG: tagatose-bisphosphate aldolase [Candidatus Kerfeldbacteria bacterium CG_4_10_14_0_8_um_filter_42_10]|uniref:Tagatose-bisphosphate aldolase n=1 Tax=Candidatus Kerfeldbacteria bacterium CG_4_10_14_0_8_um_filter_42_10 TaxID=2014248 RepID=A0A2M7RHL7_9BACT|nr:MAG: tagatose-bisphosphate aldolase [Candidatus Kerfeldbacteria bacterium CG_4_10_14_0_8_um_filter_42_10]